MHSSAKRRRQSGIPGHHQGKPASAADSRQIPSERLSAGFTVVPQHDTSQPDRQACRRRARVGQPARVGEQPQCRQASTAAAVC